MATQTVYERNRLASTRKVAEDRLSWAIELLTKLRDPQDEDLMVSPELRADEGLQMILGEIRDDVREALLLLRLQRECIRCGEILSEREVIGGYCPKH